MRVPKKEGTPARGTLALGPGRHAVEAQRRYVGSRAGEHPRAQGRGGVCGNIFKDIRKKVQTVSVSQAGPQKGYPCLWVSSLGPA